MEKIETPVIDPNFPNRTTTREMTVVVYAVAAFIKRILFIYPKTILTLSHLF